MVKLFLDKEPILFKIKIPETIPENQINSVYDKSLGTFRIPEDNITQDYDGDDTARSADLRRHLTAALLVNDEKHLQVNHVD